MQTISLFPTPIVVTHVDITQADAIMMRRTLEMAGAGMSEEQLASAALDEVVYCHSKVKQAVYDSLSALAPHCVCGL